MASADAPRASAWAWGAIGIVATFIAITYWWLSQDRGVPFGDDASYLLMIVRNHRTIAEGDVGQVLYQTGIYPPLTILVGALATFVAGLGVTGPILGENVVYVSILGLACYQVGRRVAGPQAGFLAATFALGSPLLIEQFHVFMLDAPEAAMVALAVWLILASERFTRVGLSALAGLAVGLGTDSKEQFPLFVIGLLVVVVLREGGWRNWRGLLTFAAIALAVGAPWYVLHLSDLSQIASNGLRPGDLPPRSNPPLLSLSNLSWYLWAVLNGLLFAPLFAFAAVGVGRTAVRVVRQSRDQPQPSAAASVAPELLGGLLGGWLLLSLVPHHDIRYTMPLLVYLAVLGTAWVVDLPRGARGALTAALLLAVCATTLGASFGLGRELRVVLASDPLVTNTIYGIPPRYQVTLYSDHDFNLSAPRRGDDVLALLEAVRREGTTGIKFNIDEAPVGDPVFDMQGVLLFADFAGLAAPQPGTPAYRRWNVADARHAYLIRATAYRDAPPCLRLRDGTGVWIVHGYPAGASRRVRCPAVA